MFVRFRQPLHRLQVSLAETRRIDGRVRQSHVAALGAIDIGLSPADRIAFWTKLHQRLDALSNRIDATTQRGTIFAATHARIPMPTLDDQQTVQLERARKAARFWEMLAGSYADDIEGHKGLLASTQRAIAAREPLVADTRAKAQAAKDRLARVEKGEAVDGIGAPLTRKDILKITGWSEGYLRLLPAAWICLRTTGLNFARWRAPTAPIRSRMPPCSGQSRPSPLGGRERRGQP
jgi:hypothetical protein